MSQTPQSDFLLIKLISRWPLPIAASTVLCLLAALLAVFVLPSVYRADAKFEYVEDIGSSPGMNFGAGGALGSLAAGLGGGGLLGSSDGVHSLLTRIQSRRFLVDFAREKDLVKRLFPDAWDDDVNAWRQGLERPTDWDISEQMRSRVQISLDGKTGLVNVALKWGDPQVATHLLEKFVAKVNDDLRLQAKERTEKRLAYLFEALGKRPQEEIRRSIAELIKVEIERELMVNLEDQYALRTVSAALQPDIDSQVSPDKSVLFSTALFFGLISGLLIAYLLEFRSSRVDER